MGPLARTTLGAALPLSFGDFVLERRLGRGGMGEVFLARQPARGDGMVALKLRTDGAADAAARLASEASLAASIDHPNVVRVHGAGVVDGVPWLSMEYIEGQDLEEALARTPRLAWEPALRFVDAVAAALEAAHARGVVHRDLKPSNIRLGRDGEVRVMDFGIAALGGTSGGPIVGTPAYLAPEVARGDPVDGRADLYALGVLLFRLVTGQLPFEDADPVTLVHLQLTAEPPRVRDLAPDVPPPIDQLVRRLLDKEPEARPEGAAALRAELVRAADEAHGALHRWRRALSTWLGHPPPPPPAAGSPFAPPPRSTPRPRRRALSSSSEDSMAALQGDRARLLARLRGLVPRGDQPPAAPLARTDALFLVRVAERVERGPLSLPLLPRATLDVLALLNDARASLSDAARLVASDPVLVGQVLRAANGVTVSTSWTSDPAQAVVRLGQRPLRALLLEVMARAVLLRGALVGPLARRLWEHSIGCGVLARRLAQAAGVDVQTCHVAGLLHDVGMVPLLDIVDEVSRTLALQPSEAAIRLALDRHHDELSQRVLTSWKLPELVAAAAGHHGATAPSRVAAVVAAADALCDDPRAEAVPPELLKLVGREPIDRVLLGLDDALAEVERRLNG